MMVIKEMWSVRKVMGHGLGFFPTLAEAEAFANAQEMETTINRVELHEMVNVAQITQRQFGHIGYSIVKMSDPPDTIST